MLNGVILSYRRLLMGIMFTTQAAAAAVGINGAIYVMNTALCAVWDRSRPLISATFTPNH